MGGITSIFTREERSLSLGWKYTSTFHSLSKSGTDSLTLPFLLWLAETHTPHPADGVCCPAAAQSPCCSARVSRCMRRRLKGQAGTSIPRGRDHLVQLAVTNYFSACRDLDSTCPAPAPLVSFLKEVAFMKTT